MIQAHQVLGLVAGVIAVAITIVWLMQNPMTAKNDATVFQTPKVILRQHDPFIASKLFPKGWIGPRGAFVILVSSEVSPERLEVSVPWMAKNLFSVGPYPLLVFHPSNYPTDSLLRFANSLPKERIHFEVVDFPDEPRNGTSPEHGEQPNTCFDGHGIGYRYMCRFHARALYDTKLLRNSGVEYVWRLDDDSLYFGQAPDVFQMMYHGNFLYAYHRVDRDVCVQGLWELTKAFADRRGLPFDWAAGNIYYNNFEVLNVALTRSQRYLDYIDEIDQDGGIFRYRWGDAPIKTLAVQLFVPKEQLLDLTDLRSVVYCHPSRAPHCTIHIKSTP